MADYKAKGIDNATGISSCQAGEIRGKRFEFDIAVEGGGVALALNDTIELGILPPQHVPVDFILDSDDVDTNGSPLVSFNVGTLGVGGDPDAFIAGSTIGRTGGLANMDQRAGIRLAPSDTARKVGVTVSAAPATGTTTGKIGGTLLYRAADNRDY